MHLGFRHTTCVLLIVFLGFSTSGAAYAQPANKRGSLEETYNQGVSLYRAGSLAEAADHFRTATTSPNPSLAAKARFNLANTAYQQAVKKLQAEEADPKAAAELLQTAIGHYRSALRLEPNDNDARGNIESAVRLIQQIEQQEQQNQSEDSKGQQNEDQSEQNSEPKADESAENSDQSNADKRGSNQKDSNQPEPQNPNKDESKPDDSQTGEEDSGADSEPEESDQSSESDGQSEQDSESNESSQSDSSMPQNEPPQSQADNQPDGQPESNTADTEEPTEDKNTPESEIPSGDLTAANAPSERPEQAMQVAKPGSENMTEQEARKMLQAIRDRDMIRRLRLESAKRAQRIPVDRDW